MALPETIQVRYTEEEAGYVSFRPVVRQTFQLRELLDMIVSVTGKDPARIQQILRSGTVIFHFYRYWWQGLEASDEELAVRLAVFPDADPSRAFRAESCVKVLLEDGGTPARPPLQLDRKRIAHAGFLRRRSFWDALLAEAAQGPLEYRGYSYSYRGDLYRLEISAEARERLTRAAESAPRDLRKELRPGGQALAAVFICTRE